MTTVPGVLPALPVLRKKREGIPYPSLMALYSLYFCKNIGQVGHKPDHGVGVNAKLPHILTDRGKGLVSIQRSMGIPPVSKS